MKPYRFALTATACITATLLFGSCSSDDDPESERATELATERIDDPNPSSLSPSSSGSEGSPSTSVTPTETSDSMVRSATAPAPNISTTVLSFSGDPNSAWCAVAAEVAVLSDAFEAAPVSNPDEFERTFTALVDRMELIAFVAPLEIIDDVALSVGAFGEMMALLEAVDFDVAAADLTTLDAPLEVLASSSRRIAAYNGDVCGLGAGTPTAPSLVAPPESSRDAAIDMLTVGGYTSEEAECIVAEIERGLATRDVLSACSISMEGTNP